MEDSDEIKELLREIRDLLKANYEENTDFRKAALARQQASDERIKASRAGNSGKRRNAES